MVLAMKPGFEARLGLSRFARWTRSALGFDGLCVTAAGLKIDFNTMLQTSLDYYAQAKRL
jgi:hypothetical protein